MDEDKKKKRITLRLSTPTEIRKSLSKVCNLVANGEIDVRYANSITLICNAILGSIRTDEQEKKIRELESILEEIQGSKR
jgi:hypothetical protein